MSCFRSLVMVSRWRASVVGLVIAASCASPRGRGEDAVMTSAPTEQGDDPTAGVQVTTTDAATNAPTVTKDPEDASACAPLPTPGPGDVDVAVHAARGPTAARSRCPSRGASTG